MVSMYFKVMEHIKGKKKKICYHKQQNENLVIKELYKKVV